MKEIRTFEEAIEQNARSLKELGIIETLAAFEKQGISMAGLTTVKARYTDWKTGKHALIPAIKMTIKEE